MRNFASKARASAWIVSLLSLLLVFVPKQANAVTSFTECKFSSYQAFDVQWNISEGNLNISGVTAPYDKDFSQPEIESGDYFQFFESETNQGTYGLKLFNSDSSLQQIMHETGTFSALGEDFLFYQGSGFFGTVITTTQGLAYGSSASLPVSQENPTNEQVASFASCSEIPISQVGPAPVEEEQSQSDGEESTEEESQDIVPIPGAGFENNSLDGWSKGAQGEGTLGSSITNSGTGVTVFTGSRTFTHGSRGAVGSPTLSDGSPNPYYASAVESGSWTFSPKNGTYAVLLQPKSEQTFAQAMSELGLGGSPETAIRGALSSQAQASGFGSGSPTDAAWITREVQLTAGTTYTMSWNYIGTDYVPFNDGSITSLVAVSTPSTPVITVNNSAGNYALLGFTNPGTGDYSTNSFGSTGWQISTYKVSVTGTYKLGFVAFNLDDTGLSPALMVDNEVGSTEKCVPAGSNCVSFGGVVSNNPTAPTVVPATTTTTTTPPTTTTTVPPTSIVVTSNADDGSEGTLRWAITQANAQSGGIYDSITFSNNISGTISLTSNLPAIIGSLSIVGNGQASTVIDGNSLHRVFWVGTGNSLSISSLTLKSGQNVNGGLIFNTRGTISATNVRFTGMTGGTAVFNDNGVSVATYTNCTWDGLNIGIAGDYGSTPQLPAGTTTWENYADSGFQNRTYVINNTFTSNNMAIRNYRFTKIVDSTFTNNSYGAHVTGLNRTQILSSTFDNNGIAIYHNSWIPPTFNMGTDNRLINGNTFTNNGTSIYLDDTYNNGQKHQGWSTVTNNTWDGSGEWIVYYLWNGMQNQYGSVLPSDSTEVFSQSNNTTVGAQSTTTTTVPESTTTQAPTPSQPPAPLQPLPVLPPQEPAAPTEEEKPVQQQPSTATTTPSGTAITDPVQEQPAPEEEETTQEDSSSNVTPNTGQTQTDNVVSEITSLSPDESKNAISNIINDGLSQETAVALVSSSEILAVLDKNQASEIFSALDQNSITPEQSEAIVAAVQNAPTEVKEAFESELNIYGGQFDNYVPLGSTVDVGTRRAVIAVNLVAASVATAATGLSSHGSSRGPSHPTRPSSPDLATRKDEEEDEAGEISGDGLEWIKAISIYKLANGEKVLNWSAFMRKFLYSFMNLGFTLAGAVVLFYTLSGMTRTIAMWSFGLAFAAAMYLAMKEPEDN